MVYFGETEVKVSLQGTPLSGDDLVKDWGQQEGEHHSQSHEEESSQALLGVVAVVLALRFWILLPQQQHSLKTTMFQLLRWPWPKTSDAHVHKNTPSPCLILDIGEVTFVNVSMFQITWVMTPPRATAVEAGDCSHCSGLDWGFLPRLRVQPMHRLSNMYSMDTWDTMSQTANTTRSRVFRGRPTLSWLIKKKPDQTNQTVKFLFLQRKDITYTLPGCPSVGYQCHLWNTCRTQVEHN